MAVSNFEGPGKNNTINSIEDYLNNLAEILNYHFYNIDEDNLTDDMKNKLGITEEEK